MSSDGKARSSKSLEFAEAVRQVREARDSKQASSPAAQATATGRNEAAAATDEVRAREALEGLKRIRAKARLDKMAIPKPASVDVRPTVIVAKAPPPRPTWVAPLAGLAIAVALLISACTGVIAYMVTQPTNTGAATNSEIRNLRETVTQLRRQVSGVNESLDGLRTSVDLSSKATTDRFGRFSENLERLERFSSSSTAKLDRLAQAQLSAPATSPPQPAAQMPMMASTTGAETTGSVPPAARASAPKKLVKGWSVRQAYEGIAILQGPNGVVEAVLGQEVPGLGHIEEIKNENGRLVVLSSSGTILSTRKTSP
jgi:hypothetical protein